MQVRHYVNVLNYLGVCDLKTHGSCGIRCGSSLRSSPGRSVIECLKQDAMIRHFWSQARKEDLEVDREFFSWCLRQTLSFVCFVSFASWIWHLSILRCLYRETPCCSFSLFFRFSLIQIHPDLFVKSCFCFSNYHPDASGGWPWRRRFDWQSNSNVTWAELSAEVGLKSTAWLQLSNEKRPLGYFIGRPMNQPVFRGWQTTQLYRDYFISHFYTDPY